MQRSLFQSLCAAALLVALFSLNACQKEAELTLATPVDGVAHDRNQLFYGVTVYGSVFKPSRLVEITQGTAAAVALPNPTFNGIAVTDMTGICYLGGGIKYAITTGTNNVAGVPNNSLFALDISTGVLTFLSTSTVGTVSDIDYDPINQLIYGLSGNNIVTIAGGGFNIYTSTPLLGLAAGHTARGLSMSGDFTTGALEINVAATRNTFAGPALLYKASAVSGLTALLSTLGPVADLMGGNCALGFQLQPNSLMYINRTNANVISGLNNFAWPSANPNIVTNFYGASGFFYDDLSSDVGL